MNKITKLLSTMLMGLTLASSALAFDVDLDSPKFRHPGSNVDKFVAENEGYNFTCYYEKAKDKLIGDNCGHGLEPSNGCSDVLAGNWQTTGAAAYVVADLTWNRGAHFNDAIRFVQVITHKYPVVTVGSIGYKSWDGWDAKTAEEIYDIYLNPDEREFSKYIAGFGRGKVNLSPYFFIHGLGR